MPKIGDRAKGKDIHKVRGQNYQWCACVECGKERWVALTISRPVVQRCKSCGAKTPGCREKQAKAAAQHIGAKNPCWRGGRITDSYGYILIKLYPNDFFFSMANAQRYVFEHRLVMAKHLGRCLHKWEIVHHKGTKYPVGSIENRQDNRIENLKLFTNDRHSKITAIEKRIEYRHRQIEILGIRIKRLKAENEALRKKLSEYIR